ncbi:MAG: Omp28 family outer membrane lipoprotein [Bacteroidales bacterium]|nr:Omp28 family outer membrane lipoprotein [Bacteroidales bacterium]
MKSFFYKFTALIIIALYLTACDKINEPFMNELNDADTTACPTPEFDTTVIPYRVVFLEEFTGHKCPNCPSGAATAHDLEALYEEQLVLVAIHAGFFASPDPSGTFINDFTTVEGEEIATQFGVVLNPNGLANRKSYNSNLILAPGSWGSAIDEFLTPEPDAFIQIITENSATDNDICIHVRTKFLSNLTGNFKLVVQITENSILSPQKTNDPNYPSGYIDNFEHNHVLRKTVNGTWGTDLVNDNVIAGTTIVKSYKITPNSLWNTANCKVVAYVYNSDNDEVLQAAETSLTN